LAPLSICLCSLITPSYILCILRNALHSD
jgi:hypothetical protein